MQIRGQTPASGTGKPLLLQEQPLLLEDLVEQERKEQMKQMPGQPSMSQISAPPLQPVAVTAGVQATPPPAPVVAPPPPPPPPAG
jgi:hypothetical protein